MLNKNQSNKRNSCKYLLVLPLLGAFLFFFQVKVVAQEKESTKQEINSKEIPVFIVIKKNTSDAQLQEKTASIKEKYGITLTFSGIERNSENELISIKVNLKKGKEINKKIAIKGTDAIRTFGIIISKNEKGELTSNFSLNETLIDNSNNALITPNAPSVTEKEIFINGKKEVKMN